MTRPDLHLTNSLKKYLKKPHNMVDMQYSTYEKLLLPQLAVENISILNRNQLSEEQKKFIESISKMKYTLF